MRDPLSAKFPDLRLLNPPEAPQTGHGLEGAQGGIGQDSSHVNLANMQYYGFAMARIMRCLLGFQ
jgi:hypothetical protein